MCSHMGACLVTWAHVYSCDVLSRGPQVERTVKGGDQVHS